MKFQFHVTKERVFIFLNQSYESELDYVKKYVEIQIHDIL